MADEPPAQTVSLAPKKLKGLRACLVCLNIQEYSYFFEHGCPNCTFLKMEQEETQFVGQLTTSHFEGMVSMLEPRDSWVAKWQKLVKYLPGVYAIEVFESLPEQIQKFLQQQNIPYHVSSADGVTKKTMEDGPQ